MRRLIPLLAAAALVLAACTADDPTIGPSPGAAETDGESGAGGGGGGGGGSGGEGNEPPPEVEPSTLPPGESTAISTEVEGRGTDPTEQVVRPRMLLVRNRNAGRRAAENAPTEGAADILRGWDRYADRALIAVYGGAQPDSGHRIRLDDVSVTGGGEMVTVFGAIVRREPAAEVISLPWMVLSVPANLVAVAERCILAFEGQSPTERRC